MDLGLAGRAALVLGATSGLGLATGAALADEGMRVVLVGRDDAKLTAAVTQAGAIGGVLADLTDPAAPGRIAAQARELVGAVDVLVLNGGGPPPSTAEQMDAEAGQAAFDLLVRPHLGLVQALLPDMLERGWGRVLAIGSSGVHEPIASLAASNLGRAGLAGYLKTLATEVADRGVTVNMVLPGRIQTARVTAIDEATAQRTGTPAEQVRTQAQAAIPVGRYGTPAEFAAAVAFLAGEQASYITGVELRVDGGAVRAR